MFQGYSLQGSQAAQQLPSQVMTSVRICFHDFLSHHVFEKTLKADSSVDCWGSWRSTQLAFLAHLTAWQERIRDNMIPKTCPWQLHTQSKQCPALSCSKLGPLLQFISPDAYSLNNNLIAILLPSVSCRLPKTFILEQVPAFRSRHKVGSPAGLNHK